MQGVSVIGNLDTTSMLIFVSCHKNNFTHKNSSIFSLVELLVTFFGNFYNFFRTLIYLKIYQTFFFRISYHCSEPKSNITKSTKQLQEKSSINCDTIAIHPYVSLEK